MPRVLPDIARRTVTLHNGRRSVDMPTDAAGHVRRMARMDTPQITRAAGDGGIVGFNGKFIPFGQRQWIGSKRWGYWEVNVPGCITKTVQEKTGTNNDITLNRDHDNKLLLARTSNGTLRITHDEQYGRVDADLGDYSYTKDIEVAIARKDLTGMSYAFDIIDWSWDTAEDGHDILYIREMELFDTAIVGMPANVDTDTNLRMDLLAAARSAGIDGASFDALARRLADPDPQLIATLRDLSLGVTETPAPAETTQVDTERRSDSPAETTSAPHPLAIAMLAMRTEMQGASR